MPLTLTGRAFFGLSPLAIYDASTPGSGKGLLLDTTTIICTGQSPQLTELPADGEEQRKKMAMAERNLPWHPVFRKGYAAFQRSGGYNTLLVDVYWRKAPRVAIKLPGDPAALSLTSPYPDLEETWYEDEREWGWTIDPLGVLPDLRQAVEIAERFHPSAGPTREAPDRQQIREQLRSGLTPVQIWTASGERRAYWLTAIEEEARLEDQLAAFPATPESVVTLRDERQLRWERIAARVFGDARRVAEVRSLYDQAHGPGASAGSYTGRGRLFPQMKA